MEQEVQKQEVQKEEKRPLGVLFLGSTNLFVFGILFLLISLSACFNITPKDLTAITDTLKQQNIETTITLAQFKAASITQSIISIFFIISGWGLLSKRDRIRKITVYFSFGWTAVIFLVFILHPSYINYLFLQVVYPGILILYLTHKNVIRYFSNNSEGSIAGQQNYKGQ